MQLFCATVSKERSNVLPRLCGLRYCHQVRCSSDHEGVISGWVVSLSSSCSVVQCSNLLHVSGFPCKSEFVSRQKWKATSLNCWVVQLFAREIGSCSKVSPIGLRVGISWIWSQADVLFLSNPCCCCCCCCCSETVWKVVHIQRSNRCIVVVVGKRLFCLPVK